MTDDHTAEPEPRTQRTVAFYADPRAATILLEDTVSALIASMTIERGIVDLSTAPGLAVAAALRGAGVPYDSLEFGQEDHLEDGTPTEYDAEELRLNAEDITELSVGDLGSIDANIVVIPAMVGPNEPLMDFSQGTLLGAVITQVEQLELPILLIVPPERGLRAVADGVYQRAVTHVGAAVDA